MKTLNLPFGIFVSTNDDLDAKFRVLNSDKAQELVSNQLVKVGHIIYNEEEKDHFKLAEITTKNIGIWKPISKEIPLATQEADGLMSKDDKERLDSIDFITKEEINQILNL